MPHWVFGVEIGIELVKHEQTKIIRHTKVRGERSPFDGDWIYWNGSKGDIDILDHGRFRVRIKLGKLRGIYTIVVWLERSPRGTSFPATGVCVRIE